MAASHSPSPKGVSIFLKSAALCLLVASITLAVFAQAIVRHEKRMLFGQLQERGALFASSLTRVMTDAIVAEDWEAVIAQCLKMIQSGDHVDYLVITKKADGFSLVHTPDAWRLEYLHTDWSNPQDAAPPAVIRDSPLGEGQVMHYSHPLTYSDIDWGWIHVGITLNTYHKHMQSIFGIIARMAVPALILGVLTSFLFARQLTRPISNLKEFAERVAEGDLDHQMVITSRDEVGALGLAMNRMTQDLKKSLEKQKSIQHEARLREKNVLLKEIHHRVKNNMQILTSLLRMQARQTDQEEIKTFLVDSESRVRTMGLIHEKLYQSQNISDIDFHGYVQTLAGQLIQMHSAGRTAVGLTVEIDNVLLGLDTAMPCGLIINELVSNALKYAFPDGRSGNITIRVTPRQEGHYLLEVADNGVGLGAANKPLRQGSLGSRLVEMLADQLDGTVQYRNGDGTTVLVHFCESEYAERM